MILSYMHSQDIIYAQILFFLCYFGKAPTFIIEVLNLTTDQE